MNSSFVTINGHEYVLSLENQDIVVLNGKRLPIDVKQIDDRSFSIVLNGKSTKVIAEKQNGIYHLQVNGRQFEAVVESQRTRLLKQFNQSSEHPRKSEIRAPMPALVIKVEVNVGDDVQPGQGLIILEAMKMENEIKAYSAGKVREIRVTKGKTVEKGELIMILE